MNNICFVIMPYGLKKDIDDKSINFDKVYELMIKQAVEERRGPHLRALRRHRAAGLD